MKKKRKFIIIGVLSIILIILLIIGIMIFIDSKRTIIRLRDNLDVEINDELYVNDFIDNVDNGKIVSDNFLVDTSKLGKVNLKIRYDDYFKKQKIYKFSINVIDTEKPSIEFKDTINITVGDKINLLDGVKVSDNSLEDIKVEVVGGYDINKVGSYSLKYKAVDSSGNVCEEDFTLNVEEKVIDKVENQNNVNMIDGTYTTSKGYTLVIKNGVAYIDNILIVNKTYSLPSSFKPQNPYSTVSGEYCTNCIDKTAM